MTRLVSALALAAVLGAGPARAALYDIAPITMDCTGGCAGTMTLSGTVDIDDTDANVVVTDFNGATIAASFSAMIPGVILALDAPTIQAGLTIDAGAAFGISGSNLVADLSGAAIGDGITFVLPSFGSFSLIKGSVIAGFQGDGIFTSLAASRVLLDTRSASSVVFASTDAAVPLPAGLPLLAGGLAMLGLLRRRRRA